MEEGAKRKLGTRKLGTRKLGARKLGAKRKLGAEHVIVRQIRDLEKNTKENTQEELKRKIELFSFIFCFIKTMTETETDARSVVTCIYTISVPLLIGLSLITYQYNLTFLSKIYLGLAVYFSLLLGPELYTNLDIITNKTD